MSVQKNAGLKRNPVIDSVFFGLMITVIFAFTDYIDSGSMTEVILKALLIGLCTGLVFGLIERMILKRLNK